MISRVRKLQAIFFDLDGTLVDIHGPLYSALCRALDSLGGPRLSREGYHESLSRDDLWPGVPEHQRREYMQLAFAYFLTEVDRTERLEILPYVTETLAEIKRRSYVTGVVTSRPGDSDLLVRKLAMVGLAEHLDFVITQTNFSLAALDKTESLREAAARATVAPDDCMYVGDEPRDTVAALKAGFGAAVSVTTGPATYRRLMQNDQFRPDFVIQSMGDLLGVIDRLDGFERDESL